MKVIMACFILGSLFGLISPSLPAQQHQSPQYSAQELEPLKNRVSELEKQLKTVENTEKMELQAKLVEANAKLADANAKLANVQFDRFKQDLRVDNDDRIRAWSYWFFGILGVIVIISGTAVWLSLQSLISNRVEKNLNGFKQGLKEVVTLKNEIGVLKDQQRVLEREHTTATLEDFFYDPLWYEKNHPEQIKGLREEALLDVFGDKGRIQEIRYKAIEVLIARESPQSVPPILEILNSVVDSSTEFYSQTESTLRNFIIFLGQLHTPEAYQGLRKFLNRLLAESPKHKDSFFIVTVLAFGEAAVALNMRDSVSELRLALPHLKHPGHEDLSVLVKYFDRLNEPESIKYILTKHVTSEMPEVKEQCLDVLEKYDMPFVEKWRAENTTDDAES